MAGFSLNPTSGPYSRSISLPARSHRTTLKIEEQLNKLSKSTWPLWPLWPCRTVQNCTGTQKNVTTQSATDPTSLQQTSTSKVGRRLDGRIGSFFCWKLKETAKSLTSLRHIDAKSLTPPGLKLDHQHLVAVPKTSRSFMVSGLLHQSCEGQKEELNELEQADTPLNSLMDHDINPADLGGGAHLYKDDNRKEHTLKKTPREQTAQDKLSGDSSGLRREISFGLSTEVNRDLVAQVPLVTLSRPRSAVHQEKGQDECCILEAHLAVQKENGPIYLGIESGTSTVPWYPLESQPIPTEPPSPKLSHVSQTPLSSPPSDSRRTHGQTPTTKTSVSRTTLNNSDADLEESLAVLTKRLKSKKGNSVRKKKNMDLIQSNIPISSPGEHLRQHQEAGAAARIVDSSPSHYDPLSVAKDIWDFTEQIRGAFKGLSPHSILNDKWSKTYNIVPATQSSRDANPNGSNSGNFEACNDKPKLPISECSRDIKKTPAELAPTVSKSSRDYGGISQGDDLNEDGALNEGRKRKEITRQKKIQSFLFNQGTTLRRERQRS
ncbi:hypothetical protein Ancab_003097 [Ancistrocladus abbreviatus]